MSIAIGTGVSPVFTGQRPAPGILITTASGDPIAADGSNLPATIILPADLYWPAGEQSITVRRGGASCACTLTPHTQADGTYANAHTARLTETTPGDWAAAFGLTTGNYVTTDASVATTLNALRDSVVSMVFSGGATGFFVDVGTATMWQLVGGTPAAVADLDPVYGLTEISPAALNMVAASDTTRPELRIASGVRRLTFATDDGLTGPTVSGTACTMMALATWTGSAGVTGTIMGRFDGTNRRFIGRSTGNLWGAAIGSQLIGTITSGSIASDATPRAVAVTVPASGNNRFYVDGAETYSGARAGTLATGVVALGARQDTGGFANFWNGGFWGGFDTNRALTAAEIRTATAYLRERAGL